VTTREDLPYWVEQREGYSGQVFMHGLMLGFVKGQWPVHTFAVDADGGCEQGARWAAEGPGARILVGPIPIPDDASVRYARRIPERIELTPLKETP
jgi:hypothetical protein